MVASRASRDRGALHRALAGSLTATNALVQALDPLAIKAGDEFQGIYDTWGGALRASHLVRLSLAGTTDVRFGLGRGAITTLDAATGIQDGPGWWAARSAIEAVKASAGQASYAALRTGLRSDADADAPSAALQAAVALSDRAITELDASGRRVVHGIVSGMNQAEIAEQLGVSPQSVSKRVVRGQLHVLAEALQRLWEEP